MLAAILVAGKVQNGLLQTDYCPDMDRSLKAMVLGPR